MYYVLQMYKCVKVLLLFHILLRSLQGKLIEIYDDPTEGVVDRPRSVSRLLVTGKTRVCWARAAFTWIYSELFAN